MKIEVKIIAENTNTTASTLTIDGKFICFVIEDGYRKKKVAGATRIPSGQYYIGTRRYGKFYHRFKRMFNHRHVFEVMEVQGFTDILIHTGNRAKDTRGCLLLNTGVVIGKEIYGTGSRTAYKKFYREINKSTGTVSLQITR